MHCTFKRQLKDCTKQSLPGTHGGNKHWCTDIQGSVYISTCNNDQWCYQAQQNTPEMICVQTVQRAATQNKGSLTSLSESAVSSSLIIHAELIQFFFLIPYHQSPKVADGIWNFAPVFGLVCSSTGAQSIRASSLLLGVCGLEEDNLQNFKHQQEAEAPRCPLNGKCQKTFKWYFITACTAGWWKAVSWKQVGWPVCYFCRGKNFSTQQCIMQQFCVIRGCSTLMAERGGDDMQNNCIYDFRLSASAIPRDKQRPHFLAANCVRASRGHSLHLTPLPQRKKHSWVSMDLN